MSTQPMGYEYTTVNQAQLEAAANLLSKLTKVTWEVSGKTVVVSTREFAKTWQEGGKIFENKLQGLAEEILHHVSVSPSKRGMPEGVVGIRASVSDSQTIALLAEKFFKTGWAPSSAIGTPLIELDQETLDSGARYLRDKTGVEWTVLGNSLVCKKTLTGLVGDEDSWERQRVVFKNELERTTRLNPGDLSVEGTKRGCGAGVVHVSALISDPYVLQRLSQLNAPPTILKDAQGEVRALATVAHRLCTITAAYRKKELDQPNPDRALPFPLISLTDAGLVIKLPIQLVEDRPIVDAVQNLAQKEAEEINEEAYGRTFIAKITIPPEQIRTFIEDDLGIRGEVYPGSSLLDDMIAVNRGGKTPISQETLAILQKK